ncbi:MAG: hypothetical protein JO215_03680 [Ktedonobacteraceae bacterium]|nr:hypothetical protein [Ktedonobacteraceae bacterium]MBV9616308.1 hypothetical protein [Ktedonobacteraceae bacterium]MBV9709763.1 hypothetical protein [Ktedonobacteraceae bacterium]
MKNPAIYYGVIALGVIALIVGILYTAGILGVHHARGYAGLGAGALLIIVGVVGMVMAKPKAAAK